VMPEPQVLKSPLLNQTIGTGDTNFAVHENQSNGPHDLPSGGIPLHLHRTVDEAWYVLQGTLRFRHGVREFDAVAGSGVLLPHGTPHTFWNPGPGPARYLLIVGPKTERLLESLHGPRVPEAGALRKLYASFDVDLLE